jgi:hypothetical protein
MAQARVVSWRNQQSGSTWSLESRLLGAAAFSRYLIVAVWRRTQSSTGCLLDEFEVLQMHKRTTHNASYSQANLDFAESRKKEAAKSHNGR